MDQNGHIADQKGLKMYKKKGKNGVFGPKNKLFNGIVLIGIGGSPQKKSKKMGQKGLKLAFFGQKSPFF